MDAPGVLNSPTGQGLQAARPAAALYVPAGQAKQTDCPALGWYAPELQGLHAEGEFDPMLGLYVPAAQLVQDAFPLLKYVPAGQGAQVEEPLSLYVPRDRREQGLHEDDPGLGEKEPAAQGRQAPLLPYVPVGHALQSSKEVAPAA